MGREVRIAMIRARLATLAVGVCAGCWEPEYRAEDLNASGVGGGVQAALPTDGCDERWRFPDDFELTVDFESMETSRDGFQLGELAGHVGVGGANARLFIRAGHDDLSTRSLLLMLDDGAYGHVSLRWWSTSCLDVSTRSGLRFWAKGAGTSSVQPQLPKAPLDGECVPQLAIEVTGEWRMYEHTWDKFCPSGAEPAFAQRLDGVEFSIRNALGEPWLAIDDVSFID